MTATAGEPAQKAGGEPAAQQGGAGSEAAAASPASAALATHAGLAVYCVSGTLLTLVNKVAIARFPATCSLILAQNGITVALLAATSAAAPGRVGALPAITAAAVRKWLPLTLLFVAMLFSSLEALKHISATTFVVLRNLTTAAVAAGEYAALGSRPPPAALLCVAGMLLGAAAYGAADLGFHALGYAWLAANIGASAVYQVYVKALARGEGLTPSGMAYLNNIISLPVLAAGALAMRELPPPPGRWAGGGAGGGAGGAPAVAGLVAVVSSGFLGYALSTSAFLLNTLISATAIMVANNANKFAVILLSELLFGATLGPVSTAGTVLVLLFAYLYSRVNRPPPPEGAQLWTAENAALFAATGAAAIVLVLAVAGSPAAAAAAVAAARAD